MYVLMWKHHLTMEDLYGIQKCEITGNDSASLVTAVHLRCKINSLKLVSNNPSATSQILMAGSILFYVMIHLILFMSCNKVIYKRLKCNKYIIEDTAIITERQGGLCVHHVLNAAFKLERSSI